MEIIAPEPGWMKSNTINQTKTFSTAGIVFVLGRMDGSEAGFLHKISKSANIIPFLEWCFNKGEYIALHIAIISSQQFSKFKCNPSISAE